MLKENFKKWFEIWEEEVREDLEKVENGEMSYDEFYRRWHDNYEDYNQQVNNKKYYNYDEFIEGLELLLENIKTVKEGIKRAKEIFNKTGSDSPATLVFFLENDELKFSTNWCKGEPVYVSFGYSLTKDRLPEYEYMELSRDGYWNDHLEYNLNDVYYEETFIDDRVIEITNEVLKKLKELN
ncbi:MAG: hypothetical protein ACOC2W_02515 [bacterium]